MDDKEIVLVFVWLLMSLINNLADGHGGYCFVTKPVMVIFFLLYGLSLFFFRLAL